MTLDDAIALEDAIEAIMNGCTRDEYRDMHSSLYQAKAEATYYAAQGEIAEKGSARKAWNAVQRVIESYRNPTNS